jgi:hypothetical protein
VPTLLAGRELITATPVPVPARKSARQATTIAGGGLLSSLRIINLLSADFIRILASETAPVKDFALESTRAD